MSDPRSVSHTPPPPPAHPSSAPYSQGPSSTPPSSNNNLRNTIIVAIITACSSILIYYLTVYLNKDKSSSSDRSANYQDIRQVTINAWTRYVDIDNLYYKSLLLLAKDQSFTGKPDKYLAELFKEANRFKKDAELISTEKNIDPSFALMIKRRLERETESEKEVQQYFDKLKTITAANIPDAAKATQQETVIENYQQYATRLLKTAGAEIESLSKTLTQTYGQPFNPEDVLMYKEYKAAMARNGEETNNLWAVSPPDSSNFARSVNAKSLIGHWTDNGNSINLMKDGKMNYSLLSDEEGTGTWTVENDKLRLDATDTETGEKAIWFFNLSDITANSFTAILNAKPYDTYHLVRMKNK